MSKANSLQIVLVLYKCALKDSLSYCTLKENISCVKQDYEILVYNNSPEVKVEEPEGVFVVNAEENKMLVGAYNFALKRAYEKGRNWLLLLDQDTRLSPDFFNKLSCEMDQNKNYAAIIPMVRKDSFFISPYKYNPRLGLSWCLSPVYAGVTVDCLAAINTGATLNVRTMVEMGGFNEDFPLDGLDHWYFYQFYKRKESVCVLDEFLEHNISLLDYRNSVTPLRYESFLSKGLEFAKMQGCLASLLWRLKTLLRAFKYLFQKEEKRRYVVVLLKYVFC